MNKKLATMGFEEDILDNNDNEENTITYRKYAKAVAQFQNKNLVRPAFIQLYKGTQEKKINWSVQFNKCAKEMKMKNLNEIYLRDLRVILKHLKLGKSKQIILNIYQFF